MEKKKIEKLRLKKETISNLSKFEQTRVLGGGIYGSNDETRCTEGWHTNFEYICPTGGDYTPDPCPNSDECCGTETCDCPEGIPPSY